MGSKNVLITMRVAYGSLRMEFTTGYHIDEECWDAKAQYAIGGSNGKSADEINGGLMRLSRYAHDTVNLFMEKGVEPTQEEFKTAFQMIRDGEKYVNTTIKKDIVMLKVVIRWAYRKRYHNNNMFEAFRPALKSAQKKVVFFNKKELQRLENYEIPENKLYLHRVRDVFLFQCYTGIRYSDLANLRRCDVHEKYIEITTIKTIDSLRIELNSHSRAILKKYEPFEFQDGKALPVVSNQKMNDYLHELCKMVGFDDPIRITYYRGYERFDEIKPKYEVVGTHTGRRSFICNALGMGISPQVVMKWTGHSDYKAMKPYIDVADDIKAEAMKKFDDF